MAPQYKLHYFDARGRAEAIRFMFAYGNVAYEDIRYTKEEFAEKVKPKLPFGQLPVLEIDGVKIHQSIAISRLVAKKLNLTGKNDIEAAQADALVDSIWDLGPHFRAAMGGKPEELVEVLPKFLSTIDGIIKKNGGFLVGGQLTWADIVYAAMSGIIVKFHKSNFAEEYPNLQGLVTRVTELPGIKKWIAERPDEKPM